MFESLSERLSTSLKAMAGKSRLTEDNIRETLREVRMRFWRLTSHCPWSGILLIG